MSKKKLKPALKEIPAKGARGCIIFEFPSQDPFFRIYNKDKTDFKDYRVSNYDFYVKIRDKTAVFRNGKLDISNTYYKTKPRHKEVSANGRMVMLYLLAGRPFVGVYGPRPKKGEKWQREDYGYAHPDLLVEITDKDAAFFESKDGKTMILDYTSKSMQPALVMRAGKCIWAADWAKKTLSKKDLQEIKEANLSKKEIKELKEQ